MNLCCLLHAARSVVLAAVVLLLAAASAAAAPLELSADTRRASLEGRLKHFADPTNTLPFEAVRERMFVTLPEFRSLGYDTGAHWFHFELSRAAGAPEGWTLAIGTPELEEVDIWVGQPEGGFRQYALGYHRPYDNRPLETRLFAVPLTVADHTEVYFRVHTTNAINIKADLWQPGAFISNQSATTFYHGLYFGILLVAVLLYAMLGAWLRDLTMGAYAGYIGSQALLHMGSIGYFPVLLTANAAWFTDALPRIGWLGGAIFIVLMWDRLLDLKRNYPRVHRLYQFTVLLNLALLPFALLPSLVTAPLLVVVKLANYLNSLNFFISMGLLLIYWRRGHRAELMLYFVAFVIPAVATLVNTAANQGLLAQNAVTSNLYLAAALIHVLVMSLGLTLRLRQIQHAKARAENEAALAAQRAEEQRRFVAMLSHEFRNPLAAIDRSAQMIGIKTPDLPAAEAQRLAQIRTNAATLSGFVDNFLMTEALDHGALALAQERCAIRPLLEGAIRLQGEAAGARIRLQVSPEDAQFSFDPTLMSVAVGNLLGNALRYSPPESPVVVDAEVAQGGLRIRVADQGPGMSAEELERLGTPYYRGSSSHGKKGSGLGYHFTRRIVEAHGGTLTARAAAGGGMEVEIALCQGESTIDRQPLTEARQL